jgi:mono/diheme cytochrome c family protein
MATPFLRGRLALGVVLLMLPAMIAVRAGASGTAGQAAKRTTRDKIYSKEQAARGGRMYVALCQSCHDPAHLADGKKTGPGLTGEKFITKWSGHTLGELHTTILTTMPNDGSAFLDDDQTSDLLAYLLQLNGFPEGTAAMKSNTTSKGVLIVK